MPQISEKGMAMPSSPIRKLVPFADKAKERGIKVYHLNIGQPDIATPDVALQALKNCNEKVIAYTHSAGNISYRKKLAKYYQNIGIKRIFSNSCLSFPNKRTNSSSPTGTSTTLPVR